MRLRSYQFLLATILAPIVFLAISFAAQEQYSEKAELDWRTQHATDLRKPDGWLSLIALESLAPGETSLGSASDNKIHLPNTAPAHLAILRFEENTVTLVPPNDDFASGLQIAG